MSKVGNGDPRKRKKKLQERYERLTTRVEAAESRIQELDEMFCQPEFYSNTPPGEVRAMETERNILQGELAELMEDWEATASALGEMDG